MRKSCRSCIHYKTEKDRSKDSYRDCWRGCPMEDFDLKGCDLWQYKKGWRRK